MDPTHLYIGIMWLFSVIIAYLVGRYDEVRTLIKIMSDIEKEKANEHRTG